MRGRDSRLVVLAVPTFGRRLYLRSCLESIARLQAPEAVSIHLVVLDNNPDCAARGIYDELRPQFAFPTSYVHVKERGIPFVRNAAIDAALALAADFIGFIDDDEEVPPEWMVEGFRAFDAYGGDVVSGPQVRVLPDGAPRWMRKSNCLGVVKWAKREGPGGGPISTNNVIFKTHLVRDWGLRFRTDFNLSGGSDTVFFEEAIRRGASIVWARKAKVYERVPPSRAKLSWMLRRDFRIGINKVRRTRLFDGERAAWRAVLAALWDLLVVRSVDLILQEFSRGARRAFRRKFLVRVVNYLGRAARTLGMVVALFGARYYEYRGSAHGE